MIDTQGKLLFGAFIAILIGVALIQSIGDDVELAKTSSYTVTNETLSFTITATVSNESKTTLGDSSGFTITLNNDDLVSFSELRNTTANVVTSSCNITLTTGSLQCNMTNSSRLYADYTYYTNTVDDYLANDEIVSLDAVRNSSTGSKVFTTTCDFVSSTGYVNCTNPHSTTGYVDYKWEPDTYVHSSAARTALTSTVMFFALAIWAIGLGFAWKSFKEGKLI